MLRSTNYKLAINNSYSSQCIINPSHCIDICLLLIQIMSSFRQICKHCSRLNLNFLSNLKNFVFLVLQNFCCFHRSKISCVLLWGLRLDCWWRNLICVHWKVECCNPEDGNTSVSISAVITASCCLTRFTCRRRHCSYSCKMKSSVEWSLHSYRPVHLSASAQRNSGDTCCVV
jgi:hypothetical protein